jgi:hypothetical protein
MTGGAWFSSTLHSCFFRKLRFSTSILLQKGSVQEMKFQEQRGLFRFLLPQYDEIVLFTMSFTCVLLLLTAVFSDHQEIQLYLNRESDPRIIAVIFVFIAGLVLSLYHAVVRRPKAQLEKSFMLFFAVVVNAFTGFMAGGYDLTRTSGWLIIFPILNMINSVILLLMWRAGALDESSIIDRHAPRGQVVLAAAIIIMLYYICHVVYKLVWIQTLSICLVYSTNLIKLIESWVFRLLPASDTS